MVPDAQPQICRPEHFSGGGVEPPRGTCHSVVPLPPIWSCQMNRSHFTFGWKYIIAIHPHVGSATASCVFYVRVRPWGRAGTARVPIQSVDPLMKVAGSEINLLKTLVSLHRPDHIHPPTPPCMCLTPRLHKHTHTHSSPLPFCPPTPLFLFSPYSVYPSLYRSRSWSRNFTSWWGLFIMVKRCIYLGCLNGRHYSL